MKSAFLFAVFLCLATTAYADVARDAKGRPLKDTENDILETVFHSESQTGQIVAMAQDPNASDLTICELIGNAAWFTEVKLPTSEDQFDTLVPLAPAEKSDLASLLRQYSNVVLTLTDGFCSDKSPKFQKREVLVADAQSQQTQELSLEAQMLKILKLQ